MTRYIIDTNVVYELLNFNGIQIKKVRVNNMPNIDYKKLEAFLEINLQNKNLFIAPVTIFEIINKLKGNICDLKKVLSKLNDLKEKYKYDIICENYGYPYTIDNKKLKKIRKNYRRAIIYKNYLLKRKIESEVEILYFFPLLIIMYYMALIHFEDDLYIGAYEQYIEIYKQTNKIIIEKEIKRKIKLKLKKEYRLHKEKTALRSLFEEIIIDCSDYILIPFDYICDSTMSNATPSYDISSINRVSNSESIINKYQKWYHSDNKNITNLDTIFEELKTRCIQLKYSVPQYEFIKQVILDFFTNETKMDTNDSEDFWLLGYVRDNCKIITFDKQMIRAINEGDFKNFNLIKSLQK